MSVFDLLATGFLVTGIWYGFKTFRGGGSGDLTGAAASAGGDTYRSALGVDPGGVAARRANSITDAQERREAKKLGTSMLQNIQMSQQMKVISDRIERLTQLEQDNKGKKLHDYREQLKLLEELEEIMEGTWKGTYTVGSLARSIQQNPTLYQEREAEIEEFVLKYQEYVDKIVEILGKLLKGFEHAADVDEQYGKLDKEMKKLFTFIDMLRRQSEEALDKWLKSLDENKVRKQDSEIDWEKVKAVEKKLDDLMSKFPALYRQKPTDPMSSALLKLRETDEKLRNDLRESDAQDAKNLKISKDKFSGLAQSFGISYQTGRRDRGSVGTKLKGEGKKSFDTRAVLYAVYRFINSPEGRIDVAIRHIRDLKQSLRLKIQRLEDLNIQANELVQTEGLKRLIKIIQEYEELLLKEISHS